MKHAELWVTDWHSTTETGEPAEHEGALITRGRFSWPLLHSLGTILSPISHTGSGSQLSFPMQNIDPSP